MKLSTIQATLSGLGSQPTRSLGQNFLHDQNLAEWTVNQLDLQPGEPWIEIGPGLGALTEYAAARSENGVLIEKDDRLIDYLRERFPRLRVLHGSAAEVDLREFYPLGPVKVLGNLPYYISSQIIFHFAAEPSPVAAMLFTLQRELAERLAAAPGTPEYGGPTLLIGRRWRVKYVRTLPPSVFWPVPGVESAVVQLTPRNAGEMPACEAARFDRLVKLGFSQRRKQLRKLLAGEITDWATATAGLGVPETVRAEELSLAQWLRLAGTAEPAGGLAAHAQDLTAELFDVVDEADQPQRIAPRGEVHANGWRHRAVHIFVFNARGELFLQRRSRWKDVHPLRWDSSAAGHVNAGQAYGPTAERELEEELGISAPVEEVAAIAACPETGQEFVRLYRARHEGPFTLAPAEIEGGGWFTPAQIDAWAAARPEDFASGFLKCWEVFPSALRSAAKAPAPPPRQIPAR